MTTKDSVRWRILEAAGKRFKHFGYGKTSMAEIAASKSASTAAAMPSRSPANVRTLRWCDESEVRSSSVTPGVTATTSARRVTTCGRRPSLTLGMHSINISSSGLW